MATKDVKIRVSQQGAAKTSRDFKKVDNSLVSMGKAAAGAALAFFGVGKLIQGLKAATNAAAQQELAEKKLETALGKTSTALLDQAAALQKVTTAGDEAIIEQQAFLASLKFTEDQIKTILPVALDLAAATGIILESAVRNTAKTFSGLSGELGELIPQLRSLTAEEMKAGKAVEVMADLFGGQAAENTKTMAGSIEQMKNAVGDAAEKIGDLLAPTVIKAANALKSASEFASDFLTGLKNLKEFGDTGGLEAVKEQSDSTVQGYQNLSRALARFKGEANALGMDLKKLTKESLTNDEGQLTSKREQVEFIKAKIDEELAFRLQRETEHNEALREMRFQIHTEQIEMLDDIAFTEEELEFKREQRTKAEQARANKEKQVKTDLVIADLKNAALQQTSAGEAMKAAVRAETMEAVAGYIASVLKSVPFPLNVGLAAAGGTFVGGLVDKALSNFATGGDFVTSGPQMIMVGDNPGGKERVQVTPIGSPNVNGPQGGINVNFSGPVTNDDYVRDFIIPEINKATRLDLA